MAPPKPGLTAPRGEKHLYQAIQGSDSAALIKQSHGSDEWAFLARGLGGLMVATSQPDLAIVMLAAVLAEGTDPGAHRFVQTYATGSVTVEVAEGVTAVLPIGRDAIGLVLAELLQDRGDFDTAAIMVEQLEPTAHAAVSLAELYLELGRYHDVVELTDGLTNQDNATALLCVFRAIALREEATFEAARLAFKEALKSKKRAPVIRHRALVERARCYQIEGKSAAARKDLETVLAEDSTYEGLRELLGTYSTATSDAADDDAPSQATPMQVTAAVQTPPNWYRDPTGRHQYRWWSGTCWTDTVATNGQQALDPINGVTGESSQP